MSAPIVVDRGRFVGSQSAIHLSREPIARPPPPSYSSVVAERAESFVDLTGPDPIEFVPSESRRDAAASPRRCRSGKPRAADENGRGEPTRSARQQK